MSSTSCSSCATDSAGNINHQLYLAWLSGYCSQYSSSWSGLPKDWNSHLPDFTITDAGRVNAMSSSDGKHKQTNNPFTSQFIVDKHTWIDQHEPPACTSKCGWLNDKWTSSFFDGSVAAGLDGNLSPNYRIGGAPQEGILYADLSVFCPGWQWKDLQSACSGVCTFNLDTGIFFLWLDSKCGQVANFSGLPGNWRDSVGVVNRTGMIPWNWRLEPDLLASDSKPHCSSAPVKLAAFATVNIAMLFIMPILGRRDVVQWVTFNHFGKQESQLWYLTGPIGASLHIVSNAVNAAIIKRTPGYSVISITNFTFFWCTRPRISWLIVALARFQAKRSMYLAAITSTLFSEVILQVVAGYYMVVAANFARIQGFYKKGHLSGSWYADEAMVMYAGSILWLVAVPFAITACLWTILGMSARIKRLGEHWTTSTKETTRNRKSVAVTKEGMERISRKLRTVPDPEGLGSWAEDIVEKELHLSTIAGATVVQCNELVDTWTRITGELRTQEENRRVKKKNMKKAKDRLERAKPQQRGQRQTDFDTAETDYNRANLQWSKEIPEERIKMARECQQELTTRTNAHMAEQNRVKIRLDECRRNIIPLEAAIETARRAIAGDEAEQRRIGAEERLAGSAEEIARLAAQKSNNSQKRVAHENELRIKETSPELSQWRSRSQILELIYTSWGEFLQLGKDLRGSWGINEQHWVSIGAERMNQRISEADEEAKAVEPGVGHFPIVVTVGMVLCWIAQWLWWAGYVGVAGGEYCPPSWGSLAGVWIAFSSMGKIRAIATEIFC